MSDAPTTPGQNSGPKPATTNGRSNRSGERRLITVMVTVGLLGIAIGVGAFLATRPDHHLTTETTDLSASSPTTTKQGSTSTGTTPSGSTSTTSSSVATIVPPPTLPQVTSTTAATISGTGGLCPGDDASAQTFLLNKTTADRAAVDSSVVDQWVPQLSSKYPGLVGKYEPGSPTYTSTLICQDYETYFSPPRSYTVLLLHGADYSTFTRGDAFIVIADIAFPTPDGANNWCASQSIDAVHCFAKLISHTHSPAASTQQRR